MKTTDVSELEWEVARLEGIIERNKTGFLRLKAQAQRFCDRAIRAEAALKEARRVKSDPIGREVDSFMDYIKRVGK